MPAAIGLGELASVPKQRGKEVPKLTEKQKERNATRAERGAQACEAYKAQIGVDPDEWFADMLADLMHYADDEKLYMDRAYASAQTHYRAERDGED